MLWGSRVPNLVVLTILGYVPGYKNCLFSSHSGMYKGTKTVCFRHIRVGTQVPESIYRHTTEYTSS